MRTSRISIFILLMVLFPALIFAQDNWPKEIPLKSGGKIVVYQPQIEELNGHILSSRSAVSVRENESSEPIFGAIWADATMLTDKDSRTATLETIDVKDIRFPEVNDESNLTKLKNILEEEVPKWGIEINIDEVITTLEEEGRISDSNLNMTPPNIIYKDQPTTLVTIDGEPKVEKNDDLNMEIVVNTPFFIVKNPDDKKFYLSGGYYWYASSNVKSGWQPVNNLTGTMKDLDKAMKDQMAENGQSLPEEDKPASPPQILVSTEPAELIQSDGEADFQSIEGTSLLYLANSDSEVLLDINTQNYYVLLSGRWYTSNSLTNGGWSYVAADKVPEEFAKIPTGSEKDVVLASVAGTPEAKEAKLDAQIPQTAKVDRNSTECTVTYDGKPKFEPIEGTSMEVAVNTSATVIKSNGKYYAVENGVWFVSSKADGPWKVSTERPSEVEDIPASSSAYNTKYVYIYDTSPQYVYVGYTPGYLGSYVYGPTVVYGTGFYYRPWYGAYYYPRPVTWGFGMHYNPWSGWSMSFGFSTGFFSFSFYGGGRGGWWGPPMYRPPYRRPYYGGGYRGGYYGRNNNRTNINIDNSTNINIGSGNTNIGSGNRTNNLYNNRKDVVTRDRGQLSRDRDRPSTTDRTRPSTRPGTQPSTRDVSRPSTREAGQNRNINTADLNNRMSNSRPSAPTSREKNNVYTDKKGNVYRKQDNGNWQQRNKSGSGWQNSSQNRSKNMNRQSDMRSRSQTRTNNYNRSRSSTPSRTRSAPRRGPRR